MKSLLLSALLLPGLAIAQQSRKAAMQQRIEELGIRKTPALRDYTLSEFMDYMNSVFRRNSITGIYLNHSPHRVDPYTGKPMPDPNTPVDPITGGPGVPSVPIDPITGLPIQNPAAPIDPITGLPVRNPASPFQSPPPLTAQPPGNPKFFNPEDVNIISLNYPLRGLTLLEVLDQVCRNCDTPTRFRITSIGIEFYETTPEDRANETRRFRRLSPRGLR